MKTILAQMSEEIMKKMSLCSSNQKLPTMIGCDTPDYYSKIKRKYKKKYQFRKKKNKNKNFWKQKQDIEKMKSINYLDMVDLLNIVKAFLRISPGLLFFLLKR